MFYNLHNVYYIPTNWLIPEKITLCTFRLDSAHVCVNISNW